MYTLKQGNTLPTLNYDLSISENFPVMDRSYKVDSSILSRRYKSYMPINANINNGSIDENYCEFNINSNEQEFIDTSSFALEMKIKIVPTSGGNIEDSALIQLVDAFPLMLLKRCNVALNSISIENNAHFGLLNTINAYLNMDKNFIHTIGKTMCLKELDKKIPDKFTNENLSSGTTDLLYNPKKIMHFMVPLNFDISNLNFFLLNGVDIGIRFDLASPALVINSLDESKYTYQMQCCKLWVQKITPSPDALISLNKNMIRYTKNVEYIYERPIVKQYIFPKGHSVISLDDIFNGIVPHRIISFIIRQKALNGAFDYNSLHLQHCNISSIDLDINGSL